MLRDLFLIFVLGVLIGAYLLAIVAYSSPRTSLETDKRLPTVQCSREASKIAGEVKHKAVCHESKPEVRVPEKSSKVRE